VTQPAPAFQKKLPAAEFTGFSERLLMAAICIVLLVPCFWQPRLIAGNLSSHSYNAWLAGEIRAGRAPGLEIVTVWTNVLTDWALQALASSVGSSLAAQIVAGSAVLVFFWGAFFLLNVTSGRRPWILCPILAILSYGLVFQHGFLNFYLSVGLCMWILGLLWNPSNRKLLLAAPLILAALFAHVLPVVWVAAIMIYLAAFRKLSETSRLVMPMLGIVSLMLVQQTLVTRMPASWSWGRVASLEGFAGLLGVDQAWIYDGKYLFVAGGMLLCMLFLFLDKMDQMNFIGDGIMQIWILHLAAFVLVPSAIRFPGYPYAIGEVPARFSLLVAISFCMLVAKASHGRGITRLSGVVAVAFFFCLYIDSAALNGTQAEVTRIVQDAPAGSRVVAAIFDRGARMNALGSVADQACIGHCFSYSNPEPASASYRIRVTGQTSAAAPTVQDASEMERGEHVVTPAEAPVYAVCPCSAESRAFCLRRLAAGERTCATSREFTVRLQDSLPMDALPNIPTKR